MSMSLYNANRSAAAAAEWHIDIDYNEGTRRTPNPTFGFAPQIHVANLNIQACGSINVLRSGDVHFEDQSPANATRNEDEHYKNIDLIMKLLQAVGVLEYALPPRPEDLSHESGNLWVGVSSHVRIWRVCVGTTMLCVFGLAVATLITLTPLRATTTARRIRRYLYIILFLLIMGAFTRMVVIRQLDYASIFFAIFFAMMIDCIDRGYFQIRRRIHRHFPWMRFQTPALWALFLVKIRSIIG